MAPRIRFARVMPTTALATVLVIVLMARLSPALAETLDLVCESEKGGSIDYLIDLDRKTVDYPTPSSCTWDIQGRKFVVPDCRPPARAQITERLITWEATHKTVSGTGVVGSREIRGSLNRMTGAVWMQAGGSIAFEGKCRRATRKF